MLIIRFQRVGRKNHAEFRMVVTEHTRGPKSANYLEMLGHYNPHTKAVAIEKERVLYWISKGAQVSDTVNNLLVSEKVIKGDKINVLPKKTPIVKEEVAKEEVKEDAPKEEVTEEKKEDSKETDTEEKETKKKDTEKKEEPKEA